MENNDSIKRGNIFTKKQKQYAEAKNLVNYTPDDKKNPSSENSSLAESKASDPKNNKEDDALYEEDTNPATTLDAIKLRRQETYLENQRQNLSLRKSIARASGVAVGLQMLVTNATFIVYMYVLQGKPEPTVMIAWMSSTVVQIVGIALVVAKGIFPQRNGTKIKDEEHDLG